MWCWHGHGRRPRCCGWRHGRLRLGSLSRVRDHHVTTRACNWRNICCCHYDDLLNLLALLHRPHLFRRETFRVFLQQWHRQTSFGITAFWFLHRTWSCVPFDKISKGGVTTRILSLCFYILQYRQSSEAKRLVLSFGIFFLRLGLDVSSLSGYHLISTSVTMNASLVSFGPIRPASTRLVPGRASPGCINIISNWAGTFRITGRLAT